MDGVNWNLIKMEYIEGNGTILLKGLASKYGVKDSTVRSRKNREKWDDELNGSVATQQCNVAKKMPRKRSNNSIKNIEEILETDISGLNEKQKNFCLYYVKSFNQTSSAIKAGYAPERAHVTGSELVRNSKVKAYIRQLKGKMQEELFIDAMDIFNIYVKIAFADINDYVNFGNNKVPVMDPTTGVQLKDADGELITYTRNYLDVKNSYEVDGTIISEISQGKDGLKIKLEDKMKALDKLSQNFDLFPDNFKRTIDEEKLNLEKRKMALAEKAADKDLDKDIEYVVEGGMDEQED